jgi:hypothetical protein
MAGAEQQGNTIRKKETSHSRIPYMLKSRLQLNKTADPQTRCYNDNS